MTTETVTPHRSPVTTERESFWSLVHAEWTKFRTVRGWVIADTSVTELIAAASGSRITLRTTAPADAMKALISAGAEVTATGSGVLTISNLSSERLVAILTGHAIPFTEVSAHRATLEQAYMELTSQSVEYRAEAAS